MFNNNKSNNRARGYFKYILLYLGYENFHAHIGLGLFIW